MKILLCGFMGAGKSTLLKKLSTKRLDYELIDLDHALAVELKIRPERLGDWIIKNGFALFRDLEKNKLKNLIAHPNNMVIALGGGALNQEILSIIHNNGEYFLVFLDTPFHTCLARIKNDKQRPLAQIPEDELKKLYDARRIDYLKAHLVLSEEKIKEIDALDALVHNLNSSRA